MEHCIVWVRDVETKKIGDFQNKVLENTKRLEILRDDAAKQYPRYKNQLD